jgi:hypothetical protein
LLSVFFFRREEKMYNTVWLLFSPTYEYTWKIMLALDLLPSWTFHSSLKLRGWFYFGFFSTEVLAGREKLHLLMHNVKTKIIN